MFFICHVMAMSSTCYNPFLYGRYNETFQKEFIKMIPSLSFICGNPIDEILNKNQARRVSIIQRQEANQLNQNNGNQPAPVVLDKAAPVVFNGSAVELPTANGKVAEIRLIPSNEQQPESKVKAEQQNDVATMV